MHRRHWKRSPTFTYFLFCFSVMVSVGNRTPAFAWEAGHSYGCDMKNTAGFCSALPREGREGCGPFGPQLTLTNCAWKPLDSITLPQSLTSTCAVSKEAVEKFDPWQMQKEREDHEGEGRNAGAELHHTKEVVQLLVGLNSRHILKNLCSLNILSPCFHIGPS